jgi:hypothetical protein
VAGLTRPSAVPPGGKHVYLAGAIEYAPDGGKAWRREIARFLEQELGMAVFDPCVNEVALLSVEEKHRFREWKRDDRARFLPVIRRIIDNDIGQLLERTRMVICYWDEHVTKGAGTAGELTLAYLHGIPVYLVLGIPADRLSSWAAGCATEVFATFDELRARLAQLHPAAAGG